MYLNRWLPYCVLWKFKTAAAAILDFVGIKIRWYVCFRDAIFSFYAKFSAYVCNSDRVWAGVKRNSKWRPSPSWIYFRCQFGSHDLFPVVVVYIPVKFCKCICIWSCKCIAHRSTVADSSDQSFSDKPITLHDSSENNSLKSVTL